jgi:Ni/Fe-hydrogenase subunit HybB-like protein
MPDTPLAEIASTEAEKHTALKRYLEKEIRQHQQSARYKSIAAHLLFWCVILASALGLINTSTGWFSNKLLSAIAVVPGIAIIIANTFKYDARAKWHKLKQRKLEGLCRRLVFENAPVEEISKAITIELEELDKLKVALEKPVTSK